MNPTGTPAPLALASLLGLGGFAAGFGPFLDPLTAAAIWEHLHAAALGSPCPTCGGPRSLLVFHKGEVIRSFLRCAPCNSLAELLTLSPPSDSH